MDRVVLACPWCAARRAADLDPWCHACGGSLQAIREDARDVPLGRDVRACAGALPVGRFEVSLGEGGTPLLRLDRVCPAGDVLAKAEWMNPTGSFKDRGAAVGVNVALELGARGIVVASSGNTAASVSAYAARAALPCLVILPATTARGKLVQAMAHGASVARIDGDFSDSYRIAELVRKDVGWANLTSTYINPYMTAAHATIAWEILAQASGRVGSVFVPVGSGPMLEGIASGFARALAAGTLLSMPFLVGVQSAGCAPIAQAFETGADEVVAWPQAPTGIAASINDPLRGYPSDGTRTLRLLRRHSGAVIAVSDAEIEDAMRDLGTAEGIAVEPAAASTLAALRLLESRTDVPRPAILVLSGHALKDPDRQPLARHTSSVLTDGDVLALAESLSRRGVPDGARGATDAS